jgi:SAM-dependent methyltransferase
MGWASAGLSPLSELFVEYCRTAPAPVLDIGAAYGAATRAALEAGAQVIANDLDTTPLAALAHPRLRVLEARFPRGVQLPPASLGAVHAANVLHFLPGAHLAEGFRAIARWLRPGGKLFVQAASPYMAPFAAFIPEYERRVAAGVRWPGWVEKMSAYSAHRQLSQMPRALHLLDAAVLRRLAEEAGLLVESAWLAPRTDLPRSIRLDGREAACLVAAAPTAAGEVR